MGYIALGKNCVFQTLRHYKNCIFEFFSKHVKASNKAITLHSRKIMLFVKNGDAPP